MSDHRAAWEWPENEIKRIGYRVVDLIAEHLTRLPAGPVFQPFPEPLAQQFLSEAAPDRGCDADRLLDEVARHVLPHPLGNGHPRFAAWVNSPPAVMGIFADALAAAMNPSCAGGNHAAVYVERQVMHWLRDLVGLPAGTMGLLVSGGSMAALTALAVARHAKCGFDVRAEGLQERRARLIVYRSGEGHGCHQKAIELLGIGSANLRTVAHDEALRMDPEALDAAIMADRLSGHTPIAVIASAGTVNTGAIDPIDAIADVCGAHDVWLHVDGAYGAPAILSAEYRAALAALSRADSVALDPHKWLYVPVEAGAVLIRDAAAMRAAFSLVPPYLQTDGSLSGVGGPPWLSEYGFQQTRGFRALKVWMALRYHGLEGYRAAIDRDIRHARRLADRIRAADDFVLREPQSLSIVCFRYAPRGGSLDAGAIDALNRQALERVQLGGRAFLSSTVLDGRFHLRACFVNPRTADEDVDAIVDIVRAGLRENGPPEPGPVSS